VLHELADAALVLEDFLAALAALVRESDDEAGVEERQLSEAAREDVVAEVGVREDLVIGLNTIFVPVLSVSPITESEVVGSPRRYSW
jgi:hypothetical protein